MRSTLPTFNEIWQRQFRTTVLKQLPIEASKTLLIGCSGGMDSMLLLHLMAHLFPQKVRAIYVDHQLQAESRHWAQLVQQHCQQLQLPCIIETVQVAVGNLEDQARNARYQAYQRHLLPEDVLVLGHHQQDQAETVLLRLLSGAGVQGLAAMQNYEQRKDVSIWRPLLGLSRQQIALWTAQLQLDYIEDPSNLDTHYDRAWCRSELWPVLEQRFPKMQHALDRASRLMQDAEQILAEVLATDLADCSQKNQLDFIRLQKLSAPRQRQVLSRWMQGDARYRPSLAMIERLQHEVLDAKTDAQAALHWQGDYYLRFAEHIYRLPEAQYQASRQTLGVMQLHFSLTDDYLLPSGRYKNQIQNMGLDHSLLGETLQLQPRQGGEKIHLYGRVGRWPLKKAIQAAQIFPWQRHTIQILTKDDVMLGVFSPKGFWLADSAYCVAQGWQPKLDLESLMSVDHECNFKL